MDYLDKKRFMTESDETAAKCRRTMSKLPATGVVQMASSEAPANARWLPVGNNDISCFLVQEIDAPGVCAAPGAILRSLACDFARAEVVERCKSDSAVLRAACFVCNQGYTA